MAGRVHELQTPYLDLWANEQFLERLERQEHALQALVQRSSRPWEPFRYIQGGFTSSGAVTVSFAACPVGFEWQLQRIAVSVAGASTAATLAAYVNSADDTTVVDWAVGLFGSNPARSISECDPPIYLADGEQFVLAVANAALGSNQVSVRIQGLARTIEGYLF